MSVNNKKLLANQIKEDLQKDLEEAKKEEKSERGFKGCSWSICLGEDCGSYRGNEWRLNYFGSDMDKWKEKKHPGAREGIYVFPEELEPNDWKEIESLIQQVKKLEEEKEEKETQKNREEQAKINQKLNSNPKMFLYEGMMEWAVDYDPRGYDKFRVFRGVKNGQEFHLVFPENHPSVVNFSYSHNDKNIFQIEEVENIPFQPKEKPNKQLPWKKVNLSDKFTIAEFKENPEIRKPAENKPIDNFSKSTKEIKEFLLQWFQKGSIKSIKLKGNKLVIEYNNNSQKESKNINNQELEKIKSFTEKLGKSELSLSDLEQSNNLSNSPNSSKGLYIGLVAVGVLVMGIIVWLLIKKNKRTRI